MNHYKIHKPEAIDLILKYDLNFVEGNVIKYILRSPFKGDSECDLKKALHYAKLLKPKPHFRRIFDDCLSEYTELSIWLFQAVKVTIEGDITLNDCIENFIVDLIEKHIESNSKPVKDWEVEEKIGPGDKEFWKNRCDLFWKQTKKRYMSKYDITDQVKEVLRYISRLQNETT